MSGRNRAKAKKVKVGRADLNVVFEAFQNAYMPARETCRVMEECDDDNYGTAISVLYQCAGALTEVSDKLQEAAIRFSRFHRKNANVQGGVS